MTGRPMAVVWAMCAEWDRRDNAMSSTKPNPIPDPRAREAVQ